MDRCPEGAPILHYHAFAETDEARFIAQHLQTECMNQPYAHDGAILYRASVHRALEEALNMAGIPTDLWWITVF